MDWLEIFVETSEEGIEPISGLLYQHGLTGLMIQDKRDFAEFMENPNRQWDYIEDDLKEEKQNTPTGITFFLRDNSSGRETYTGIKSALSAIKASEKELDLGSLQMTMKNVKEEDWANNWKKYFKPFPIGEKILIKPSWEELTEPTDRKILNIDPGHIFGTGTHETTQLCIELIEKYCKEGDNAFDIGCGSGILSIAALLLGAGRADAVDIDPNAIDIAYENAERNGISHENYFVYAGDILEEQGIGRQFPQKSYDVVMVNIVADIIIAFIPKVAEYIKDNGVFIASGIITERLEDVKEALQSKGFSLIEERTKKDWAAIAASYEGVGNHA